MEAFCNAIRPKMPQGMVANNRVGENGEFLNMLKETAVAMKGATKNAKEMIENLTLERNKVRQAGITKEMLEITSGAEGLK